MLRLQDIQEALGGLVGWEQGFGPNAIIDDLTTTESGLTFQAAHPLVTLENIRQIMPTEWGATDWSASEQYYPGQAVNYGERYGLRSRGASALLRRMVRCGLIRFRGM